MNRERVIGVMRKAILSKVPEGYGMTGAEADEYAGAAFDAMVRACVPKGAEKHPTNGTYWQKTFSGQKMINRITVNL